MYEFKLAHCCHCRNDGRDITGVTGHLYEHFEKASVLINHISGCGWCRDLINSSFWMARTWRIHETQKWLRSSSPLNQTYQRADMIYCCMFEQINISLGWQWVSYKWCSFPVVDKHLRSNFICTSRASGRGIIMETGSYRFEFRTNIHCYQLTNQSIYRKNIPRFWLQFTVEELKSSGQQRNTLVPSLCLSIQDSPGLNLDCFKVGRLISINFLNVKWTWYSLVGWEEGNTLFCIFEFCLDHSSDTAEWAPDVNPDIDICGRTKQESNIVYFGQ